MEHKWECFVFVDTHTFDLDVLSFTQIQTKKNTFGMERRQQSTIALHLGPFGLLKGYI